MTCNGRQAFELIRPDMQAKMAGAAARSFVPGMQVGFVDDLEVGGGQWLQAGFEQFHSFCRHYERSFGSPPGARASTCGASSLMCLPSHSDCRMTNSRSSAINPKTLKLTHWASVNTPENAT